MEKKSKTRNTKKRETTHQRRSKKQKDQAWWITRD